MSTKEWFYAPEMSNVGGYQEMTFEQDNNNPAVIQVESPEAFYVVKQDEYQQVTLSIDANEFDKLAIAWCKKRKLHGPLRWFSWFGIWQAR